MTGPLHPDLDALSAALDGEDDATASHAASCPTCGPELERLAAVREMVASDPEPLPDPVVDRLVTAAVRASTVTPFSEARRRGPRRPPLRWAGVAAAAVAVMAALPALFGALGGGSSDMVATGGGQEANESQDSTTSDDGRTAAAMDSGAAAGRSPAVAGSDLGDQSDPDELARVVAAMTAMGGDQYGGAQAESAPPEAASQAAAAAPPAMCETEARDVGAGRLGALVYRAAVRWRGEPAEVLAFDLVPGDGVRAGERQLYVLSRPECALRAEKRF